MLELEPFFLTLKLATVTTFILFLICIPLAFWLAYGSFRPKIFIEALISLPMILPPSVLGFYLLLAFSPANSFGQFLDRHFDVRLVFTFAGLTVASVIYSLPFMVQPLLSGFRMVSPQLIEASYTLGKSRFTTLMRVLLPNTKAALITALILTFAHTIGEFGVVLMVGGNIPGKTRVVSVAIYDEVEAMNYSAANKYSLILLIVSFVMILSVYVVNQKIRKNHLA